MVPVEFFISEAWSEIFILITSSTAVVCVVRHVSKLPAPFDSRTTTLNFWCNFPPSIFHGCKISNFIYHIGKRYQTSNNRNRKRNRRRTGAGQLKFVLYLIYCTSNRWMVPILNQRSNTSFSISYDVKKTTMPPGTIRHVFTRNRPKSSIIYTSRESIASFVKKSCTVRKLNFIQNINKHPIFSYKKLYTWAFHDFEYE